MKIEFRDNADAHLDAAITGGRAVVEELLMSHALNQNVNLATIAPLSPGLSGATVFQICRMGTNRAPKQTWLLKASQNLTLIAEEKYNYYNFVKDQWLETPKLIHTERDLLIYEFGGPLGNFGPTTLRAGYSRSAPSALVALMVRLVESLSLVHVVGYDNVSFISRVKLDRPLFEQLARFAEIPEDRKQKLLGLWKWMNDHASSFPRIRCLQGHGDLNSGNVLFQAGNEASYPVFIDFASMVRPDAATPDAKALPFSDFAKIERDLKTRMFLKEAIAEKLESRCILNAVRDIDLGRAPALAATSKAIEKLARVVNTLRKEIQLSYQPRAFSGAYNVAVAITSLSVLFRTEADTDVDHGLQVRLAVETAITLIEDTQQTLSGSNTKTALVAEQSHAPSPLKIFRTREIRDMYESMRPGAFAWIFSTDGFIETVEPAFFKIISEAVRQGISISYFFPRAARGEISSKAFSSILEKLIQDIDESVLERVHGYFVSPEGVALSAQSSRFVVFGNCHWGTVELQRIFLYIHSQGDFWIELNKDDLFADFMAEMTKAIDGVKCRPLSVWHDKWALPSQVKHAYRLSFRSSDISGSYRSVRDLLHTQDSVAALSARVAGKLKRRSGRRPYLEWLDVGCEDGENTGVIFDTLKANRIKPSLQAIETSIQNPENVHNILKYSPFLNGPEWTFEDFVSKAPYEYSFDLITSIHSWYVIDPIYLLDAYRTLSPIGIIALIISPYKNNVLNTIIGTIDTLIGRSTGYAGEAYAEKVVVEDPYRNFAEDVLAACNRFFVADGVELTKREVAIPRDCLISAGRLNDSGKQIARFFCHGIIEPNAALFTEVEIAIIKTYGDANTFPCEEWNIIVDRRSIASRLDLRSVVPHSTRD